jgi:EF hand
MKLFREMLLIGGLLSVSPLAFAQRPDDDRRPPPRGEDGTDDVVTRMMEFDKNKDGKLSRSEVTDTRLRRLFDRADANKDKVVTRSELSALAAREQEDDRGGPRGFGGPGGPPPDGEGPGGPPPGGPGGPRMGPPGRLGDVLPQMAQQRLNLTTKQQKQVAELQQEVDAKLSEILTAEQRTQFKQMRERGPGGGPPFGRGGPPGGGGPGGGGPRGGGGPPGEGRFPGGGGPPPPPDR